MEASERARRILAMRLAVALTFLQVQALPSIAAAQAANLAPTGPSVVAAPSLAESLSVKAKAQAFLATVFGPPIGDHWAVRLEGQTYRVSLSYGWHSLGQDTTLFVLSVSGAANTMHKGRETPGYLQVFYLRDGPTGLVEVARSEPMALGAQGRAPQTEGVLQIGSARYAVVTSMTQAWQGAERSDYFIYAPNSVGNSVVQLGSFATYAGQCGRDMEPSECWSARLQFRTAPHATNDACWPLSITRVQRSAAGRTVSRATTTLNCSEDATYPTPKSFKGPFF